MKEDSQQIRQVEALCRAIRRGDERAASRVISWLEAGLAPADAVQARLYTPDADSRVIGVTGPPGAGKSTLVDTLIAIYRRRRLSVAVLAVDPSSPFSGGALLGDRLRMGGHGDDPDVFIRSMANRGHMGGIALAARSAIRVIQAMGFDRILVETVGAGQSEIAIASAADCTVLVLVPGAGDSIQAMKSGIMEIADLFVVNKSDRDGAGQVQQDIQTMLQLRGRAQRVLLTRADRAEGAAEAVAAIEDFLAAAEARGDLAIRRREQREAEVIDLLSAEARRYVLQDFDPASRELFVDRLLRREIDPARVALDLLRSLRVTATPQS